MPVFVSEFDRAVWKIVLNIPCGQVMSYGEVSTAAGYPGRARQVSRAMSRSVNPLPWYRVVRSDRTLAFPKGSKAYSKQKKLLEQEGIKFTDSKIVTDNEHDRLDKLFWGPEE
jgi:methylated-DNA-protein-cysteine methyltransferase-like protein